MLRLKRAAKGEKGFLLLEVLVSITIISVGLIYVVRSFSSSTRAIETTGRFIKSITLAEEKLWEFESKRVVRKGRDEGEFREEAGYKWQIEAEEHDDIPINRLALKVNWQGPRKRKQSVSVETYLWNEEE